MPRDYRHIESFDTSGTENQISGLMRSLIGIQQRKEEKARQAMLDAQHQAEIERRNRLEDEDRQFKVAEFMAKMSALTDRPEQEIPFERRDEVQIPGKAPLDIPDDPAERAAWESGPPVMGEGPTPTHRVSMGGQQVEIPLFDRSEMLARAAEEAERVRQEKRKTELAEGAVELTPEMIQQMPEALRSFLQPGQLMDAPNLSGALGAMMRPGAYQRVTIDGTDMMATPQEIDEAKAAGKSVEPYRPDPVLDQQGMSPVQHRDFVGITTKFQNSPMMQQVNQGKVISRIADQVIANPETGVNQLKALYILVKNLDPTSAVREGELTLAQLTQSYLQRFQTAWNRIDAGQVIHPDAARELARATKEIAELWDQGGRTVQNRYRAQAAVAGIGPQFEDYLSKFEGFEKEGGGAGGGVIEVPDVASAAKLPSGTRFHLAGEPATTIRVRK